MLKDKYILPNRYGDLVQLVKQDGNLYLLDGDLDYMRDGFNEDKSINFVESIRNPIRFYKSEMAKLCFLPIKKIFIFK